MCRGRARLASDRAGDGACRRRPVGLARGVGRPASLAFPVVGPMGAHVGQAFARPACASRLGAWRRLHLGDGAWGCLCLGPSCRVAGECPGVAVAGPLGARGRGRGRRWSRSSTPVSGPARVPCGHGRGHEYCGRAVAPGDRPAGGRGAHARRPGGCVAFVVGTAATVFVARRTQHSLRGRAGGAAFRQVALAHPPATQAGVRTDGQKGGRRRFGCLFPRGETRRPAERSGPAWS